VLWYENLITPAESGRTPIVANLEELEEKAKKILDKASYDFIAGGAGAELTLKANREAFDKITIIPRVLTGIQQADTSTTLLGQHLSMPIYLTPMSNQGVAHVSAEEGTGEGTNRAGTLYVAPTGSNKNLEEIAISNKNGPRWFQLYYNRNSDVNRNLLQRVEKAGYSAIVLTVDLPVLGLRERNIRNQFSLPKDLTRANVVSDRSMNVFRDLQSLISGIKDDLSWEDYEWVRKHTSLPVLIKGILSPEDAEEAMRRKVPGIIVSNHGGRQLDTGLGAIEALPPIVERVAGKTMILMDSGVRKGIDVFKALALGANAVGIGRPALWGLAVYGAEGVAIVLNHLRTELQNVMRLAGVGKITDITTEFVGTRR
jgi:lactate oxidase